MTRDYKFKELRELIQARAPMLMLDRARVESDSASAWGVKAVSVNEEFFTGHFPGNPIMPGVLQIAAMVQLGELLSKTLRPAQREEVWEVVRLERVKFRRPVVPGDCLQLSIHLDKEEAEPGDLTFKAESKVDGRLVSQALITLRPLEQEKAGEKPEESQMAPAFKKLAGIEPEPDNYYSVNQIAAVLPHRYPFLLLDRVLRLDIGQARVLALKNVSGNEAFLAGLSEPVAPLFLLTEMAAQAGWFLALQEPGNENKLGYFMAIDRAVSKVPVTAGDQLLFDSRMIGKGRFGRGESEVYVGDSLVAEIAIKFVLVEAERQ